MMTTQERQPQSNRGFTLLEAIVGMGVMSISIFAVSSLVILATRQQKDMEARQAMNDLNMVLERAFFRPDKCRQILQGVSFAGGDDVDLASVLSDGLKDDSGRVFIKKDENIGGVITRDMRLIRLRQVDAAGNRHAAVMRLGTQYGGPGQTLWKDNIVFREFPVVVETNGGAGAVQNCYSTPTALTDPQDACEALRGTWIENPPTCRPASDRLCPGGSYAFAQSTYVLNPVTGFWEYKIEQLCVGLSANFVSPINSALTATVNNKKCKLGLALAGYQPDGTPICK